MSEENVRQKVLRAAKKVFTPESQFVENRYVPGPYSLLRGHT
jgi:hypothetical protein